MAAGRAVHLGRAPPKAGRPEPGGAQSPAGPRARQGPARCGEGDEGPAGARAEARTCGEAQARLGPQPALRGVVGGTAHG